ncbi:MAG: PstS family phosphate ABC transporter substrate-binding protein [Armatimonadetes bacterium]|nr:PstS family phosphate ABC transporter substrate-binding protein [Armatimonadota bacterium]
MAGCAQQAEAPADAPVEPPVPAEAAAPVSGLAGEVKIDGSSTVAPISEAVAEEFQKSNASVKATVGTSGTGGGFKKLIAGEIDIADASRPIKSSELESLKAGGTDVVELPVAYDGLAVVVNPKNDFVDHLTVAELKKIWEPESKVTKWSQVRQGWPDREFHLYGPGTDSGTFDYFTDAIVGDEGKSRSDYTASEDDNTLVTGVSGDPDALGYFGFAYYAENQDKLKLVPIDGGSGPITASAETIRDGTYQPLSRPLFIYVSSKSIDRPEIQEFVKYYLSNSTKLVEEVGYVSLPARAYELALARFQNKKLGSIFSGGSQVGVKIEDLLAKE